MSAVPSELDPQHHVPDHPHAVDNPPGGTNGRRYALMLLLVLLAAIPRFLLAARGTPICDDGYFYLAVADALEHGAYKTALWYLNVNVYPVLLTGIEALGLPAMSAAKFWGAAVGALTVLPLWGWSRRLVDHRVALAATLIYAMHPRFIEISAEPIRDTTFWFLFVLTLYCSWRAATERRLTMFLAAGLAMTLAAHTRTEGWLLTMPMLGWPLIRLPRLIGKPRIRLIQGIALSCAMTPAFLLTYNATILANHPTWELGKLGHFRMVMDWLAIDEFAHDGGRSAPKPPAQFPARAISKPAPTPEGDASTHDVTTIPRDALAPLPDPGPAENISEYVELFIQSLKPVPLLLMLLGAIVGRDLLWKRDNLILSAMFLAICLGVWIRLSSLGEINGRYFLTGFFPAAGSAGLGLIAVGRGLTRLFVMFLRPDRAVLTAYVLLAMIGLLHVGDVLDSEHLSRQRDARIGRSLEGELGGHCRVLALPHAARVGHYVGGELPTLILDDTPIQTLIERSEANVAVLEFNVTPAHRCADLAERLETLGWQARDISHISDTEHFLVFTRSANSAKTASSIRRSRHLNR